MRCDQKPTPGCNGREMLTGHGLIVRIESSGCLNDASELKERIREIETNQGYCTVRND
ncbi:conserved protein of unknown function [Limnospira indica PCC 8005]|uniref:Uncharacterized protein n=1 Tax=Limnospira indica PCC 8005 TaxID=376219 RepID=A0A9P1KDY4_9CYAN|nr:conserved protein of unknown function [Limnospira indica PCC 8005]